MYVSPDFKTKKALKEAVAAGKMVTVYQPNDIFGININTQKDGVATVEGPHFPEQHTWGAQVTLKDGLVIVVK